MSSYNPIISFFLSFSKDGMICNKLLRKMIAHSTITLTLIKYKFKFLEFNCSIEKNMNYIIVFKIIISKLNLYFARSKENKFLLASNYVNIQYTILLETVKQLSDTWDLTRDNVRRGSFRDNRSLASIHSKH